MNYLWFIIKKILTTTNICLTFVVLRRVRTKTYTLLKSQKLSLNRTMKCTINKIDHKTRNSFISFLLTMYDFHEKFFCTTYKFSIAHVNVLNLHTTYKNRGSSWLLLVINFTIKTSANVNQVPTLIFYTGNYFLKAF